MEKIHHQMNMRVPGHNIDRINQKKSHLIFLPRLLQQWTLRNWLCRYRCMKSCRKSTRDKKIESNSKRQARKSDSTWITSKREASHLLPLEVRLRVLQLAKKIPRRLHHLVELRNPKIETTMTFSRMQTKEEPLEKVTSISISEAIRILSRNQSSRITRLPRL